MSVKVEKLEKNMAKLTMEVPAEELEKAIQGAYLKQKNRINIPARPSFPVRPSASSSWRRANPSSSPLRWR